MINNLTLLLKCGPRKAWLCYGKKNSPFLVFLNKEPIYLNNVPPGPPHSVCNRSLALSKYASCWCELSLQYKSKHLCAWLCQWILYTFALQKWITLRFTLPDWILLVYLRLHFFITGGRFYSKILLFLEYENKHFILQEDYWHDAQN